MELVQNLIKYYVDVTGKDWLTFYDNLQEAMELDLTLALSDLEDSSKDELLLIQGLINIYLSADVNNSIEDLLLHKDEIKSAFEENTRRDAGEFYTPIIWAEELHKYLDKHIPNWRTTYNVWDASAGTGNLVKTSGVSPEHLFVSTLQEDDMQVLESLDGLQGATIFNLDFLNSMDDDWGNHFIETLPKRLQEIILNDEPLIFLMNPPYRGGMKLKTIVGHYMQSGEGLFDYLDVSASAYDLFFQFCYKVASIAARFKLTNCYYCFLGPVTLFNLRSSKNLNAIMQRVFEFKDGMVFDAAEFLGTSSSKPWAIGGSLWKSRGGYKRDIEPVSSIYFDEKHCLNGTEIETRAKLPYGLPEHRLINWLKAKDIASYTDAPVMTSCLTFADAPVNVKVTSTRSKKAVNALAFIMCDNRCGDSYLKNGVLSVPSTLDYIDVTPENFWRVVFAFGYKSLLDITWRNSKLELSEPIELEKHKNWVASCLVLFLVGYKSQTCAMRNVDWDSNTINIFNTLCFLSETEIRSNCTDEKILEDLNTYGLQNEFILQQIESSKEYWFEEAEELYKYCKNFVLESLNKRKDINYDYSLECADAGFKQVRMAYANDDNEKEYISLINKLYKRMRIDIADFEVIPHEFWEVY